MLLNIVLSFTLLFFSSCTIEGEEICGIWNTNSGYGEMQVEITPWKGKFLGYLLSYKEGNKTVTGSKTEEFIFITDLVHKEGKYQGGKIYFDPKSETYCGLKLELLDDHQLKAIYNCDGQTSDEIWYRKGFKAPSKSIQTPATAKVGIVQEESEKKVAPKMKVDQELKKEKIAASKTNKSSAPTIEGETQKQSSFSIIGIQEIVNYDDNKEMEKVIEALWTKAYNDDFSGKLKNIEEANNMYVSYSRYDNPKGKMTITLGYKVTDLSDISSTLKGVTVPANDYLVYPMSGEKSDYEGECWDQLGELMMYRKATSTDFEVYTFDNNYNVTNAVMWVATK